MSVTERPTLSGVHLWLQGTVFLIRLVIGGAGGKEGEGRGGSVPTNFVCTLQLVCCVPFTGI